MDIQQEKLAKKYAKAFVNLYAARLNVELVERLQIVSDYLHRQREALFYVQLSALDGDTTKKNFEELLKQFSIDSLFNPLIELLLRDKRIFLLSRVIHYICVIYLEKNNIMHFTVESPVNLNAEDLTTLKSFLSRQTGKTILFSIKKNKNLIAGIKAYSDSVGFEHSIRKQLRALSRTT